MNVINYRVSLDMFDTLSQATIKAKKGDSACKIHITLTENGKIYKISEGCYATLSAKKSDGTFVYDNCTIEGNDIYYDFTSSIKDGFTQITACEGIVECEVALYKGSEQLTSPRFTLVVDGTVYNGEEIVSSDEADALKGLINTAQVCASVAESFADMAEGYAASAGESAATATASATTATEAATSASFSAEASNAYAATAAEFSAAAKAAAERAEAAGGGSVNEWEQIFTETLAEATHNKQITTASMGLSIAKIVLKIPPDTTFSNNRVSATIRFKKLTDNLERRIAVYAEGMKSNPSYSTCVIKVAPTDDVWNVEIAPYQKTLNTVQGDVTKHDGDEIITVQFQTADTNPLPVGTEITIYAVKTNRSGGEVNG